MELSVKDMSCGHCVQSITKAIQALDANSTVAANLTDRTIKVDTAASEEAVKATLSTIGFDAE